MSNGELFTVRQAAALLGNTVQHVRLLARAGQLKAKKVGRDWIIDRDSVMDLRTKRATTPLMTLNKRGRRPITALIHESKNGYFPKTLITGLEDSNLTHPVKQTSLEQNDFQPLTDVNVQQLEMDGIGEISSFVASSDTKIRGIDFRNKLNDLTATEWLPETVSVWVQKGLGASHPDAQIERQHPAPFSFSDVARLIRFFTKRGAVVLDPFVGVGSTLKACALYERYGVGIELNPRYVQLTHERLLRELPNNIYSNHNQKVIQGDAREVLPELLENTIDFVVTSPPYSNILHKEDHKARQERIANGLDTKYSDDPRDLGNIHDYKIFLDEVAKVLGMCGRALKPKKYMAVIVSDYRHGSKYVMFHADLARSLEDYDFRLRGIIVLYQRHKRVFPYGYPFSFVPNIHHQFILVLQNEKW
jgi:excisionase family DNA binding protein